MNVPDTTEPAVRSESHTLQEPRDSKAVHIGGKVMKTAVRSDAQTLQVLGPQSGDHETTTTTTTTMSTTTSTSIMVEDDEKDPDHDGNEEFVDVNEGVKDKARRRNGKNEKMQHCAAWPWRQGRGGGSNLERYPTGNYPFPGNSQHHDVERDAGVFNGASIVRLKNHQTAFRRQVCSMYTSPGAEHPEET